MSGVVGGPVLQKVCELWTLVRSRQRPVGWLSYSLKTLQRMLGGGGLVPGRVLCTQHCVIIIPQLLWHDLTALALALQPPEEQKNQYSECFFIGNSIYYINRLWDRARQVRANWKPRPIILDIIALLYYLGALKQRRWAITVTIRSQWRNVIEIQWLQ